MNQNQLLEKAFAFRSLKPWESLEDRQIFAARLRDQLCYLHVMGQIHGSWALAVYAGEDAIERLLRLATVEQATWVEVQALALGQSAIHCQFHPKDSLKKEEAETIRARAAEHGVNMRRKNAWPVFRRLVPLQDMESLSEEDAEVLDEAFDLVLWLAQQERQQLASWIPPLGRTSESIPFFSRSEDGYRVEKIPLQTLPPVEYPEGYTNNDIYKARVRKMKKEGAWACELVICQELSKAEGVEGLYYPWELLTVDLETGRPVWVQRVRDYEHRTEVMLDKLAEAFFRVNECPATIVVSEERTEALLREWCRTVGIDLAVEDKPEELQELEARQMMEDELSEMEDIEADHLPESLETMLDLLLSMPDSTVRSIFAGNQKEGRDTLRSMMSYPITPQSVRKKTGEMLDRLDRILGNENTRTSKTRKKKKKQPEKSYVISVSIDTGCYRHLQISSNAMLSDLSEAILDAFEFVDDHCHGFFMDNRVYSDEEVYYCAEMEEPDFPRTDRVSLAEAGLIVGLKFKYVFDFGEDWTFQCRVLRELEEITQKPIIVRKKGEPPCQYPDWEEDWDEEDWDDDEDEEDWDDDE